MLRKYGLAANTRVVEGDAARGTIVDQSPKPGSLVVPGSVVLLSVAAGPAVETNPRDSGQATPSTSDDALQLLRVLQLRAGYGRSMQPLRRYIPRPRRPAGALNQLSSRLRHKAARGRDRHRADNQTASVTASKHLRPPEDQGAPQTGTAVFCEGDSA